MTDKNTQPREQADQELSALVERARLATDAHCDGLSAEPSKEYSDAYFYRMLTQRGAPEAPALTRALREVRKQQADPKLAIIASNARERFMYAELARLQAAVIADCESPVAAPEAPTDTRSFWVLEKFADGRSAGYWDGGHSISFTNDIDKACQFCRKMDAFWATRGWRGNDTQLTEHVMLSASTGAAPEAPVQMILHCPKCGKQHVDEPDERTEGWVNPPHRSHLCHGCGHIWRPADVPTEGVKAIQTRGKADSPLVPEVAASEQQARAAGVREAAELTVHFTIPMPVNSDTYNGALNAVECYRNAILARANAILVTPAATTASASGEPLLELVWRINDAVLKVLPRHPDAGVMQARNTKSPAEVLVNVESLIRYYKEASDGAPTPSTTASASDGSIYESVSRRANPEGHAEAMAQLDEVLGRAPAPSRNAAPLDMRSVLLAANFDGQGVLDYLNGDLIKLYPPDLDAVIRAALTQQSAAQPCPTCGGSKVDPGGLPICRGCGGAAQESHAGADTERLDWLMKNNSDASLKNRGCR